MFFSSPPLGIEFRDATVYVAQAKGQKILCRGKGKDLKEALASFGSLPSKKAVLCLPPAKVYTHLFQLPVKGKQRDALLKEEIGKMIPEEINDLTFVSKVLTTGKDPTSPFGLRGTGTVDIGVVAVRKDVLQHYTDTCKEAGLKLISVVTLPVAAALLVKTSQASETFLLVTSSAVTLFHKGWPIDEALLPEGVKEEKISEEVEELQNEYSTKGMSIEKTVTLEEVLPWLQNGDLVWAGATAASLAGGKTSINLLENI